MDAFSALGLSQYENAIYTALLEFGRLNAKEIAERSSVPPTAVYPNLDKLEQRDLVQRFEGQIAVFEAVNPAVAIPAFIKKQKEDLDEKQALLLSVAERIYHQKQITPEPEVLTLSLGKEASSAIYYDALIRAQRTFYVLGWSFGKVRDKFVTLHHLAKARQNGVDVRIISNGTKDKAWTVVEAYLEKGILLKYLPLENFSLMVADEKECKITLKSKEYSQKFNIHVKDKALAQAMHSYYLSLWKKAEVLKVPR